MERQLVTGSRDLENRYFRWVVGKSALGRRIIRRSGYRYIKYYKLVSEIHKRGMYSKWAEEVLKELEKFEPDNEESCEKVDKAFYVKYMKGRSMDIHTLRTFFEVVARNFLRDQIRESMFIRLSTRSTPKEVKKEFSLSSASYLEIRNLLAFKVREFGKDYLKELQLAEPFISSEYWVDQVDLDSFRAKFQNSYRLKVNR